jgi:polysaccharide biosynthesis/export protein
MVRTVRGVTDWLLAKPFCLLAILIALSSQTAYSQETETPQQTNEKIQQLALLAQAHPTDTPIGSGDLIHIDVFDVPELSRDLRVSETGDVSYPLIPGRIQVAGLTSFQLESKLERLLIENGLVSHPQVSVFVREQTSEPVSVVGAVNHTMVYQVVRPTTLLEVLSAAGGVAADAGSVVIITRPIGNPSPDLPHTEPTSASTSSTTADAGSRDSNPNEKKITIRIKDLLESGDSVYNIPIYGGDTITVPPAGIVYVLGFGIAQPGGYVLQGHGDQITVLRMVALAHGLTNFSKPDDAIILRNNPLTGNRDQIPVHIKQIQQKKTDDVPMKSNDILYVPDSKGKKVLARGSEAAISVGTGLALYRVY